MLPLCSLVCVAGPPFIFLVACIGISTVLPHAPLPVLPFVLKRSGPNHITDTVRRLVDRGERGGKQYNSIVNKNKLKNEKDKGLTSEGEDENERLSQVFFMELIPCVPQQ